MMGTLQFGSALGSRAHDASTWTISRLSGNVEVGANAAAGPTVFWEVNTLNLTNFEVQDETVFFGNVQPQLIGAFGAEGAYTSSYSDSFYCNEVVVVTERLLETPYDTLLAMANNYPPTSTVGGASGKYDPMNVIYGHFRNYGFSGALADQNGSIIGNVSPYLVLNVMNTWGSGQASANDEVYFYRMVVFGSTAAGGGTVTIGMPEMNIVWTAVSEKEKEMAYFARIRRSWMDRVG